MHQSRRWRGQQILVLGLLCGHTNRTTPRRSIICHHYCNILTMLISALPSTCSRLPSSMLLDLENLNNSDSVLTKVVQSPQRSATIGCYCSFQSQHRRRSQTQQHSLAIILQHSPTTTMCDTQRTLTRELEKPALTVSDAEARKVWIGCDRQQT